MTTRSTSGILATIALAVWSYAAPVRAAVLSIQVNRMEEAAPLRALEPVEFDVTLSGGKAPYANPFDADEVTVDATLNGPKGRRLQIPAFWEVPYARATSKTGSGEVVPQTATPAGWRVRLRPTVAGQWSLTVAAHDASGDATSAPLKLQVLVARPEQHGFIERANGAGRARYFQYSDGTPYFAIGENVCWPTPKGLPDYDGWFGALGNAGGNYARLWMAFNPLESQATGLKHYDQKNAAYFDQVLSSAEGHGLACMLCFGTYGEFTTGGFFNEGKWSANPYNAANGGPVDAATPDAFFTDDTARRIYKNRLRYLVARYGASTSVGFWELWNEKATPPAWMAEMAAYLKSLDPYHRPVTSSYSTTGTAAVWNLADIDLSQTHRYGDEGSLRDIATGIPSDTRNHDAFHKPHLLGEFGISWRGSDIKFDPQGKGTNLHNGLWASALAGNAGSAMIWWWDSYVDPQNLYHEFTPLARFARQIDWPRRAFEPLKLPAPVVKVEHETFSNLRLEPEAIWGIKSVAPVEIGNDGALHGVGTLLSYLYNINGNSPDKKQFQGSQDLAITMPNAGELRITVGMVSNFAELQVRVDGQIAGDFSFDASPAGPGGYQETKQYAEYGGIYQARFDVVREVPLGAGPHHITLENVRGDWLKIDAYEFTGLRSSRFTTLRTTALQDKASGETLVWLQDTNSNWQNDRDGKTPVWWRNVTILVPVPGPSTYHVEWWDTRLGQSVLPSITVRSKAGQLTLAVPPFTRDIALRITSAKARP